LTETLPEVPPLPDPKWIPPPANPHRHADIRIHATVRMQLPARKRKEARRILGSMIERIKLEEGCLSCHLYLDALKEGDMMLHEIWADEKSLERHLRSEEFRTVLLVVEMASKPPDIRFDRITKTGGIEVINVGLERNEIFPGGKQPV
jgi:quinol monooxygenase YgiN